MNKLKVRRIGMAPCSRACLQHLVLHIIRNLGVKGGVATPMNCRAGSKPRWRSG